jgi:hypothetical protein
MWVGIYSLDSGDKNGIEQEQNLPQLTVSGVFVLYHSGCWLTYLPFHQPEHGLDTDRHT